MIKNYNRAELYLTYDMNERVRICDILNANEIDYHLKTINPTASTLGSSRRASSGTFGLNMDVMYEYHIYVHKRDLELATHLIHNSK